MSYANLHKRNDSSDVRIIPHAMDGETRLAISWPGEKPRIVALSDGQILRLMTELTECIRHTKTGTWIPEDDPSRDEAMGKVHEMAVVDVLRMWREPPKDIEDAE